MYNTTYRCVKPFTAYDRNKKPIKIERKSIWGLCWCGGEHSFKELTNGKITLSLPDILVAHHFKKI